VTQRSTSLDLVSTSPRVPAGQFNAVGWSALQDADRCLVAAADPQHPALTAAGFPVLAFNDSSELTSMLTARLASGERVALLLPPQGALYQVGPTAEETRAAAAEVAAQAGVAVTTVIGSDALPGSALLDAATLMDRLRSPGGCPWDADQTHRSLARYLIEEAYETVDAIERDDSAELREEIGDVLLQVVFHARIAAEQGPESGWDIDTVAEGLVAKMVRRHPHVFTDRTVAGAAEVASNWAEIKAAERAARGEKSSLAGVPQHQPALALTRALQSRSGDEKADPTEAAQQVQQLASRLGQGSSDDTAEELVGQLLFAAVSLSRARGVEPETALRQIARRFREEIEAR
jgi:XTP/dITP diphosphohydrolase